MILNDEKRDVITFGEMQETEFSMDEASQHIIFDILRSKVYKNNIGAICREIASNGRDAQREKGDFTTPIEIAIVDNRESFFYEDGLSILFRDFGVGISRDRVQNIYTKYGASTKRESNVMTGGFGLGAKTPFSYTDAFIVRTIVDGEEYVYSIYIDVTKKGKMALLSQQRVENHANMTEIIIPLQEKDVSRFEYEVIRNTHFWDVRPKLINFKSKYKELEKFKHSSIVKDANSRFDIYDNNRNPSSFIESTINVVIDGIYYPVDNHIVDLPIDGVRFSTCLYFDNGELNISANRETLQYDDNTIDLIKKNFYSIYDNV